MNFIKNLSKKKNVKLIRKQMKTHLLDQMQQKHGIKVNINNNLGKQSRRKTNQGKKEEKRKIKQNKTLKKIIISYFSHHIQCICSVVNEQKVISIAYS